MKEIRYVRAITEALREEMARDENIFIIGEDVGAGSGAFSATRGLLNEFGDKRVKDTPISESSFVGLALGAAITGLRPVVEIMFMDFLTVCMDQIVNQIAKIHYMSGGKLKVPIVMRAPVGVTGRGAQHAQNLEAYFLSCPGIKLVAPSTAYDAAGLLRAAVRDDDPVMTFEHKLLYGSKGPRQESGILDASSEIPEEEPFLGLDLNLDEPGKILELLEKSQGEDAKIIFTIKDSGINLKPLYRTYTWETGPKTYFRFG